MLINDRLSTFLTQHADEMAFVQRSHYRNVCEEAKGCQRQATKIEDCARIGWQCF